MKFSERKKVVIENNILQLVAKVKKRRFKKKYGSVIIEGVIELKIVGSLCKKSLCLIVPNG